MPFIFNEAKKELTLQFGRGGLNPDSGNNVPPNAILLNGQPIMLNGQYITLARGT